MSLALASRSEASGSDHHTFRLDAAADPGLLLRALGLFAKLNVVPVSVRAERDGDGLRVEIRVEGLGPDRADHIAQLMAGFFGVGRVGLS